jgi:hypothetical protein
MKSLLVLVPVALIAALALANSTAAAKDMHRVLGGGVATFDSVARLSSYFAVDATVLDAGDARGQFASVIVDFAVVIGTFSRGTVNDDGSVTLEGTASGFFLDGTVSEDFPCRIVVWEGGPKTGRFLFKDPDNGDGDYQTLSVGTIRVIKP